MSALPDAVAILRCFSLENGAHSHGDLVRHTGLAKSTVSRLLGIMRDEGVLSYDEATRCYRPGLLLFQVGRLYRTGSGLLALIEAQMLGFAERVGHTAYVAVRDGAEQTVLRAVPGKNPLRVITPVGERSPVHATSNGRALLARMPDVAVRALFSGDALPAVSPGTPRSLGALTARLTSIRRTGVSEAANETLPGVSSLGIAIVDPETGENYGIAASFSSLATGPDEVERIRQALLAIGHEVGTSVGDAFWAGLPADRRTG